MATIAELTAEKEALQTQLTAINTQILAIINQKNKKYTYSNQETTHAAETQSLEDLRKLKKDILEQLDNIERRLCGGVFVKVTNI